MGYYLLDHPNRNGPAQYGVVRRNGGWMSGVFGVHTTESPADFEGPDPGAENTASWMSQRLDYGSYHIMADADSILDLAPANYEVWADTTNNVHAMSVSGAMQAARWRELTPERAARLVKNMAIAAARKAQEAVRLGYLKAVPPARRITAAQAISGSAPGFYGHGETNPGTRYDPGAHFDWDLFLKTYAEAVKRDARYIAAGAEITPIEDWLEALMAMDKDELVELLDDRLDAAIQRLLRYDGTTRTDRSLYALWIDGGLNAAKAVALLGQIQTMLDDLPRQVQGYEGAGETVDVYRKINDLVGVVIGGLDPALTVTAQESGALAESKVIAKDLAAKLAGKPDGTEGVK